MQKLEKAINTYNLLAKGLFACAIGSIGFMLGGPMLAAAGILVGIVGGNLLEKNIIKLANK
jgi:hypothetical protein